MGPLHEDAKETRSLERLHGNFDSDGPAIPEVVVKSTKEHLEQTRRDELERLNAPEPEIEVVPWNTPSVLTAKYREMNKEELSNSLVMGGVGIAGMSILVVGFGASTVSGGIAVAGIGVAAYHLACCVGPYLEKLREK